MACEKHHSKHTHTNSLQSSHKSDGQYRGFLPSAWPKRLPPIAGKKKKEIEMNKFAN